MRSYSIRRPCQWEVLNPTQQQEQKTRVVMRRRRNTDLQPLYSEEEKEKRLLRSSTQNITSNVRNYYQINENNNLLNNNSTTISSIRRTFKNPDHVNCNGKFPLSKFKENSRSNPFSYELDDKYNNFNNLNKELGSKKQIEYGLKKVDKESEYCLKTVDNYITSDHRSLSIKEGLGKGFAMEEGLKDFTNSGIPGIPIRNKETTRDLRTSTTLTEPKRGRTQFLGTPAMKKRPQELISRPENYSPNRKWFISRWFSNV